MSKNVALLLVLVLAASNVIAFLPVKAQSQTIVVPDDYPKIQAAINNAVNGDTIFVKTGIYEEQVLTLNKTIALIGEDPSNTIIDLYPPTGPYGILGSFGIDFPVKIEANNAILLNFKITSHGHPPIATNGGFISATGSGIEIIGNTINTGISAIGDKTIIVNNTVTSLFLRGSSQTIAQNTISGEGRGWGIWMEGSVNSFVAKNNVLTANGNGINLRSSTLNQIVGNNISGKICVQIDNYYGTSNLQTRSSDDNIFCKNNFISSTSTFIDQVGYGNGGYSVDNTWYKGTEGNYWSDYQTRYPNAAEIDNSGTGDTPYVIDANNIDPYPLIAPYDISSIEVPLPFNALLQAALQSKRAHDTTPPKITLSPLNHTYNESSVSIVFTVDKTVNWVGYSLDGKQNVTINGAGVTSFIIANMTNGLHNITVYAEDTYGNIGASETLNFTIAKAEPSPTTKPEPFPTTLVIASVITVAVVGIGLLVYFKKRKR
jgi:parallel beta-helix repeat protein